MYRYKYTLLRGKTIVNEIKTLEFSYIVRHRRRYCGMLRNLSVSWIIFVLFVIYVGVVLNFQSGKSFAVRWRRQTKFLFFFANFRRVLLLLQGSSGNNGKVGRWKIWRRGGGIRLSSFLQISPKVSSWILLQSAFSSMHCLPGVESHCLSPLLPIAPASDAPSVSTAATPNMLPVCRHLLPLL